MEKIYSLTNLNHIQKNIYMKHIELTQPGFPNFYSKSCQIHLIRLIQLMFKNSQNL